MANANTNLMSMVARPANAQNSSRNHSVRSSRPDSEQKTSHYHSRGQKNNFKSELDKANAQINSTQQTDEVKTVAESAESESVDTLAKTSNHGKNNETQDAPQNPNQHLAEGKKSHPVNNSTSEKNFVSPEVAGEIVQKFISSQNSNQSQVQTPTEIPADLPTNPKVEISTENVNPQVATEIQTEIPLDVGEKISVVAEVPTKKFSRDVSTENPVDVAADNANKIPDAEVVTTLATSADMAFYFTENTASLLSVNELPAEVDKGNLMSIMPQSRDNKAQSMLDFLSGKTWTSTAENETSTNQNLNPQLSTQLSSQQIPIQPQYQSRPLNLQTNLNQSPLQIQMQPQENSQPLLNQNPLQIQTQPQENFQPLTNQNPLQIQTQPQENFQPLTNQNPLQIQTQPQENFQPLTNQIPLQVQTQPQENFQPLTNQIPLQAQTQPQENFQPLTNQIPLQVQTQPQENFQPLTNQIPLQAQTQPQQQNNFQPLTNQNPLQVQTQPQQQNNFQPLTNQNPLQVQTQPQQQNNFQPLTNQNPLQAQTQPTQIQQQFGAQIQPQINSLQPQLDSRVVNPQTLNEVLGVPVQIDDAQPTAPIMPLQEIYNPFEQNQNFSRNFKQNFTPFTANAETQTQPQTETVEENFVSNFAPVNHTSQTQQTAQIQTPEVTQTPREDFNVPAQIVEQARMIRNATNTEMVINLKPEHLGELTLRVSVTANGAVNASFYSDNAQVRAIIETSIVQLKQELNEQGLKVDNVEVYAGLSDEGLLNGQGQQAWQQNQQRNHRGTINLDAVEEEVESLNPIGENISEDGVDYKI